MDHTKALGSKFLTLKDKWLEPPFFLYFFLHPPRPFLPSMYRLDISSEEQLKST